MICYKQEAELHLLCGHWLQGWPLSHHADSAFREPSSSVLMEEHAS